MHVDDLCHRRSLKKQKIFWTECKWKYNKSYQNFRDVAKGELEGKKSQQ